MEVSSSSKSQVITAAATQPPVAQVEVRQETVWIPGWLQSILLPCLPIHTAIGMRLPRTSSRPLNLPSQPESTLDTLRVPVALRVLILWGRLSLQIYRASASLLFIPLFFFVLAWMRIETDQPPFRPHAYRRLQLAGRHPAAHFRQHKATGLLRSRIVLYMWPFSRLSHILTVTVTIPSHNHTRRNTCYPVPAADLGKKGNRGDKERNPGRMDTTERGGQSNASYGSWPVLSAAQASKRHMERQTAWKQQPTSNQQEKKNPSDCLVVFLFLVD
ncbi:hypothetical protein B0T22DRAFT_5102 [Podospora appendiculata]|uniref:Uncharacterized protein n=1 Tax=Podospora appendiculata TaxID=314037 RepID=A0AAE0XEX7_9PEZI|nr:hypothetical protein B0T22DRAFT_5102 [Podospora appendiculata]